MTKIDVAARRKARRATGGTRLHRDQRAVYQEKLLNAAEILFSRQTYGGTSIKEIVHEADVSRATFYRHFDNKLALVGALTDRLIAALHVAHDLFLEMETVGKPEIEHWINANINLYVAHSSLVHTVREAASIEPVFFRDHSIKNHNEVIFKLGRTLRAFQVAGSRAADDPVRLKAHVLIRQLDMLCYDVAITRWSEGRGAGCDLLARQFLAFLEEVEEEMRTSLKV